MTTQCVVRAALTEERSKTEINSSALRCRDEKSPFIFKKRCPSRQTCRFACEAFKRSEKGSTFHFTKIHSLNT